MHNHIVIHGYFGHDPELKEYTNNKGEKGKIVTFSVGVSRDLGDETDWFRCAAFGRRAEVIDKFFGKGSQIMVWGRMQSSKKDGKTYWDLIVEGFDFCDSKDSPRGQNNKAVQDDSWDEQEGDIPF